jgi:hypothetical protein
MLPHKWPALNEQYRDVGRSVAVGLRRGPNSSSSAGEQIPNSGDPFAHSYGISR